MDGDEGCTNWHLGIGDCGYCGPCAVKAARADCADVFALFKAAIFALETTPTVVVSLLAANARGSGERQRALDDAFSEVRKHVETSLRLIASGPKATPK